MKKGVVNTPSILTPAENASILVMDDSLAVTASAFGVNAGTDTHEKTDWKLTSDAAGNTVIQQALNSTNKTAHTFSGLNLGADLGTIDEMLAIFPERAAIDSIDPTVASYPTYKLENWGFGTNYCWSSSAYNNNGAWAVSSSGSANYNSKESIK